MSSLLSPLVFVRSNRLASALLGLVLTGFGVAIYLSPSGSSPKITHDLAHAGPAAPTPQAAAAVPRPSSSSTPSTPKRTTPSTTSGKPRPGRTVVDVVRPPAKTDVVVVKKPGRTVHSTTTVVRTVSNGKAVTVHVPGKSELIDPAEKYYGLAEDGLPGSGSLYDKLDNTAGKAPDLVEWFEYWDDSYSPQKVTQAWSRGALPVITWQSAPHDFSNTSVNLKNYSMANIAGVDPSTLKPLAKGGTEDHYLKSFAASVVSTGLPVAIRLDQEMNGNWYPWSAGYNSRGIKNTPQLFRMAWQHIWNIFQDAGANKYVIWAWTPSRTNTLTVDSHSGFTAGDTGLIEDYPGDAYVDWMGMSAYQFRPTEPATYDWIFGGTLTGNSVDVGLECRDAQVPGTDCVSRKPIFIAEWGSAQEVGSDGGQMVDNTENKVAITTATLQQFASDPQIVGFSLFNNNVDGLHTIKLTDGTHLTVNTNWQFDSSPAALAAFQKGITVAAFGSGLMPLPAGTTVKLVKG